MPSANRLVIAVIVVIGCFAATEQAVAAPTFGADCTRCHYVTSNRFTLRGTSAVNLGSKRLDRQKPGALQTFVVKRGKTVNIPVRVINGKNIFAVGVSNFSGGGLSSSRSHQLAYTVGSPWRGGGNPLYYLYNIYGQGWTGTTTITFPLTIKKTCAPDYYELYVRVGGIDQTGRWVQVQRIYLHVE